MPNQGLRLALLIAASLGAAKGNFIPPVTFGFGSLTYTGIAGSGTKTSTFYVGSTADLSLTYFFGSLYGAIEQPPNCDRGYRCVSTVSGSFSISGAAGPLFGAGSSYDESCFPDGFCTEAAEGFSPFPDRSGLELAPGVYTSTVSISLYGGNSQRPVTNTLSVGATVLSGTVSSTPEPSSIVLFASGFASILYCATRRMNRPQAQARRNDGQ